MVESFQRISIELAHSSINHTIYIGIRVRQHPVLRLPLFLPCLINALHQLPFGHSNSEAGVNTYTVYVLITLLISSYCC